MVLNIPASDLLHGVMGGQVLMAYGSPAPQPRTGKLGIDLAFEIATFAQFLDEHRYVVLLWEHTGRRVGQPAPQQRAKFKVKAFQEKHNIGKLEGRKSDSHKNLHILFSGDPIAGNYFTSQPDA